jgi:Mn-containing catalase
MLQDIAMEEFSHLEMVGKLIVQHTAKLDQTPVFEAPLFQVRGIGPHLVDSQGCAWTASYVQEGGNVVRDLRADISAEAGARQTYEALIKRCDDEGTKKVLVHLLTREITHANMFMAALDQMDKLDDPMFGNIEPDETSTLSSISPRAMTTAALGTKGRSTPGSKSNTWPTRSQRVASRLGR